MRVALLVRRFPTVSETFVVNEVRWLLDHGHSAYIVPERLTEDRVEIPPDVRATVVTQPRLPSRRAGNLPWLVADMLSARVTNRSGPGRLAETGATRKDVLLRMYWLRRVQRLPEIDAFHCHFGPSALFAARAKGAGFISAPFVATFHGQDVTARPFRHNNLAMYGPVFEQASVMTVGSEFMKQKLTKLGAPPDRVVILPQAVDTALFAPAGDTRRTDSDGLVVLSVGRLTEVKGMQHALRAFARARREVPALRYVIVGDGPQRIALETLARDLGLGTDVDFRGSLDYFSVAAAYREADIVLLSGVRTADGQEEGQGLAPLEAAATGLPVVASSSGGLAEAVLDGTTGVLVTPGDEGALCQAVVALAGDPGRRLSMGAAGRERVLARFSLDVHMTQLLSLLDAEDSEGRHAGAKT